MGLLIWKLLAIVFLLLGFIGVVLPIVPTVPFLLLAAGAASRGWPWLDQRLTSHAVYGPLIRGWRERRAVPRLAKWFATLSMAVAAALQWALPLPLWVRLGVPLAMLAFGWWLWRRPEI